MSFSPARAGGVDLLKGRCYDEGPATPYGPFVDAIRAAIRMHGIEQLARAGLANDTATTAAPPQQAAQRLAAPAGATPIGCLNTVLSPLCVAFFAQSVKNATQKQVSTRAITAGKLAFHAAYRESHFNEYTQTLHFVSSVEG